MLRNRPIILIAGLVIVAVLVYFLFFYNAGKVAVNSNQNSVNIVYNNCTNCSNSAMNTIYNLFKSDKYTLNPKNLSFDSSEGISLISNYSVTALPTVIINESNKSP